MIENRLTLAVVLGVAVQAGSGLVWAGATGARIEQLETRAEAVSGVEQRLARVEVQLAAQGAQLDRIETKLDGR